MLNYNANLRQKNTLEGLAYRIADSAYIRERYGEGAPELIENQKTIDLLFADLDRLAVPYWVQNAVIAFAADWRRYKTLYMWQWLRTNKSIFA